MSEPNAAGRKTEDAFEAEVAALNERIEIQKARLGQAPEPRPKSIEPTPEMVAYYRKMRKRTPGDGLAPDEALNPPALIDLPSEVSQPDSTRALLNAQLLECAAMMRDAGWLYRNSSIDPHERGHFISQAVNLMEASTKMGDAIRRLGGGEDPVPTTRHVMVVERVEGGGGKASLENE